MRFIRNFSKNMNSPKRGTELSSPWRPLRLGRRIYLLIAGICIGLLTYALWLQTQGYPPCPLCILARIAFILIMLGCLLAAAGQPLVLAGHAIATLGGVFGAGVSLRHQWALANPNDSCGIDPLERWINQFALTDWWPAMFEAQGACSTPLPPVFGLQVPAWSMLWLFALTAVLLVTFKQAIRPTSR
jgi:disulfide bond formation protein DsbB